MESDVLVQQSIDKASALPPATGSSRINVGTTERIISVIGGAALSVIATRNIHKTSGKILAVLSAILLKRGATGYCEVNAMIDRNTANRKAPALEVKSTLTVKKPRSEVYAFWRNLENLPQFMRHLKSVKMIDERRSKWSARVPGGLGTVSWEAVLEEEAENSFLSWSSIPSSTVDNAGQVQFKDDVRHQGTEIKVCISYRLPAGDLGSIAGKLFNPAVEKLLKEDLRRFKAFMETGEIPITGSERAKAMRKRKVGKQETSFPDNDIKNYESPVLEP